jgi:uncharacterized membrane protein
MDKGRLEAFSDGVIAIIITIMVLEFKVPAGPSLAALRPIIPVFLSYVLSFVFIGIYWNSHHHLLQATHKVNGSVLWANMHLLFWLSLIPIATEWLGQNHSAPVPVALYGTFLLMAGTAYTILVRCLISSSEKNSVLARAVGRDYKGKASLAIYAAAILMSFVKPAIALVMYVLVAAMWFIPDRRIERVIAE